MEKLKASGIILAGGRSSRIGTDKAYLNFEGKPLLHRIVDVLDPVAEQIIIVGKQKFRQRDAYLAAREVVVTEDLYPGKGPLVGIYSGLAAAKYDYGLVVACDMPFLNPGLLRFMFRAAEGYDGAVIYDGQHYEPLHAVYAKSCLAAIHQAIRQGERKVTSFFGACNLRIIGPREIEAYDCQYLSFYNINTKENYRQALLLEKPTGTFSPDEAERLECRNAGRQQLFRIPAPDSL